MRVFLLGFLVGLSPWLQAGEARAKVPPITASSNWLERKWTVQEGLPGNIVPSILQSRSGRIWIGTLDGLAWSDGLKIYPVHSREYANAPDQGIWSLLEARDGTIWIGGHNGHIHAFRKGRFENLTPQGIGSFNINLGESGDGTVWAGGPQGLWRWTGQHWIRPTGAAGAFIVDIKALAPAGRAGLWIGTRDKGLWCLEQDGSLRSIPTGDGLPNFEISHIVEDLQGRTWVGSRGFGLCRVEGGRLRQVPNGYLELIIESMQLGRGGNIWVGSNLGLFRTEGERLHPFQEATFGHYSRIPAVLEDREGTLWAGTWQEGLVHLRRATLDLIGPNQGLTGGVFSLAPRRAGGVWLTTSKGEIRILQGATLSVPGNLGTVLPDHLVGKDILEDAQGVVWIGTLKGLYQYHDGAVKAVPLPGPYPRPLTRVLHEAPDGALWVGTQQGLFRWKDQVWTQIGEDSGLTNSYILSIQSDPSGRVLIGTNGGGLCVWEKGRFKAYHAAQGLPSEVVFRGHRTADGAWWFGTSGGLARMVGETLQGFEKADETLPKTIYQVLEDGEGNLWLTSSRAVLRLEHRQAVAFLEGREAKLRVEAFDQRDGLPVGGPTSVGESALSEGHLLVATMGGVIRIEPAKLRASRPLPLLEAIEVRSGGRLLLPGTDIEFQSGSDLEIRYAGHTSVAPERVTFRYLLEGFDKDWRLAGDRRAAFYTRVPPGRYRFRVQATQDEETWHEGAPLPLRISPRWHERPAVRLGGLVALLATLYALFVWRNRASNARALRLEAVVRERTRELTTAKEAVENANRELEAHVLERTRDLQDALRKALAADEAKTLFLARMSHEFRTPLNHMLLYAELLKEEWPDAQSLPEDDFRHIHDSGRALEALLSDLLDFAEMDAGRLTIREAPFDPAALIRGLEETFKAKASAKGLTFEVDYGNLPKALRGDGHRVGQILRDLVSNAVKFTETGKVWLEAGLLPESGKLTLAVQDSGPGIPKGFRTRLFSPFEQGDGSLARSHGGTGLGLSLVQGLVALMGGTLRLVDPPEGGTRFEVELPIRIEEPAVKVQGGRAGGGDL